MFTFRGPTFFRSYSLLLIPLNREGLILSFVFHLTANNIRFNHRFEVVNVCCGTRSINARREAEDINVERGPQQTLTTEHPWLHVIITHS